jgi:hypothetical protein
MMKHANLFFFFFVVLFETCGFSYRVTINRLTPENIRTCTEEMQPKVCSVSVALLVVGVSKFDIVTYSVTRQRSWISNWIY